MANKLMLRPKAIGCLFFTFLLLLILVLTNVQAQTSFSGNVLIKSDGTFEPSSSPIQRTGETYKLLSGFTGNITVQIDNIVLDGAGFGITSTITGTETTIGVDLSFRRNVTVTGLQVSGFVQGILLQNSTDCTVIANNLSDNIDGIRVISASGNSIIANNITANRHGVHPDQDNVFYHNNFVNSSDRDVFFDAADHIDTWDNGYPSGGNYWSNYTGVDQKKGVNQNEDVSDGIGDTPQTLSSNNVDRYPLMAPYVYVPQSIPQQNLSLYIAIVIIIAIVVIVGALLYFRNRNHKKMT